MLDMCGGIVEVTLPKPQIDPQRRDVPTRPETGSEQSASMQPLQPLRIVNVGLAARNSPRFSSIRYDYLDPPSFKDLVHGHPVHTGRFHGDRLDPDSIEPIRHPLKISGECLKRLHGCFAKIRSHRYHVKA